jgi:hypothetical protein
MVYYNIKIPAILLLFFKKKFTVMKNTENVTLSDYRGLSDELIKNLLSDHILYDGTWWLNAFKRFLRKENPWDVRLWDEWKIISYGGDNATPKKLRHACKIKDKGFKFDGYAFHSLKNLKTSESKGQRSAGLMVAPLKMLGFEKPATILEVNERIKELGFFLFTEELVFNLFSQIENNYEYINIAMDPVKMPDGQNIYFAIKKSIISCGAKNQLPIGYNVVFVTNFYTTDTLEALENR